MVEAGIVVCGLIYAFIISITSNLYVLAIILALSLCLKKFPPLALNLFNALMMATMILTWGDYREGFVMGLRIVLRVNIIYIALARFVIPLGVAGIYKALVKLGVPEKLRVLVILTLRGIDILRDRFDAALISSRLRAPKLTLRIFAYITGSVLLQSSRRSEKMLQAIKLRGGFGGFTQ